jgi:hypothetical protein
MDWVRGSCRMASLFARFLSVEVQKGLGIPNQGTRCGRTALPNNCSLWDFTPVILKNTWRQVEYRWTIYHATGAARLKMYYKHRNLETSALNSRVCIYISSENMYFFFLVEILPDAMYFTNQICQHFKGFKTCFKICEFIVLQQNQIKFVRTSSLLLF